jgi:hypothetical protein
LRHHLDVPVLRDVIILDDHLASVLLILASARSASPSAEDERRALDLAVLAIRQATQEIRLLATL